MSAVVGLAMVFAAILIGRAAKIGIPMQPPPWWATDNMSAFAILPGAADNDPRQPQSMPPMKKAA
jgi:hypothetical protein